MDFNTRSAQWDTPMRVKRAATVARKIADFVPVTPGMEAMEFGCGTGLVSFALQDHLRSILLVDASDGMLKVAQEKIREAGVTSLHTMQHDLSSSEGLPREALDLVFMSMALHHVSDVGAIAEVFRTLLKPGGHLCVVDLDEDGGSFHADEPGFDGHNGFDQKELADQLGRHGFTEARSETFFHDQKDRGERIIDFSLFILCTCKA